jgi:hypothetical protein
MPKVCPARKSGSMSEREFLALTLSTYRCPIVAKKLHNLFVIRDINFFFFLDDSYASTAYSENIAVYIQAVPML